MIKLLFGLLLTFLGILGLLDAIGTRNPVAAVGGYTISLILLLIGIPLLIKGARTQSKDQNIRKCPDCAEAIQVEAKICRFCGKRFEAVE